jgi:hypothetical protein
MVRPLRFLMPIKPLFKDRHTVRYCQIPEGHTIVTAATNP